MEELRRRSGSFSGVLGDLKDEFTAKPAKAKATAKKKKQDVVFIADPKRRQNMAIFSKTLTKGGRELWQVADIVLKLDARALGANALSSFVEFVPQQNEVQAAQAFLEQGGNTSRLGPAERFVCAMLKVPRLSARVPNMLFKVQFDELVQDLETRTDIILHTSNAVQNSKRFGRMLSMILTVGNELNRGTYKGNSAGFKLSSLAKLTQTKTNKGGTLLQYLVQHLIDDPKDADLLKLPEDFPELDDAARMNLDAMNSDMGKIRVGIRNMGNTLKLAKADDGQYESAIAPFLERAQIVFDALSAKYSEMQDGFSALCKYLGMPPPPRTKPEALFGMLKSFTISLKGSVRRVKEARARKARMEKREAEKRERIERIKAKSSAVNAMRRHAPDNAPVPKPPPGPPPPN